MTRLSIRRLLLALVLAGAAGSPTLAQDSKQADRPPNIVLVLADDLGWADVGCYGNRFNETPRIDKLASEGVRFTDAYASAPVCSPTRAGIMSGRYQARYGLTAHIPGHWRPFEKLCEPPNALHLPLDVQTVAESLKDAGYSTGYFGKWHLGGKGFQPQDQGFDEVFEFTGPVVPPRRQSPPGPKPVRSVAYLTDKAVQFIKKHSHDPFYVQVSYSAVHIPLTTTPELQAKYEKKPRVEGYSCHPLYAGLLEEMDTGVGRLLDTLEGEGLTGNTLFIFTSDNGGLEREAGGWPGTDNAPLRNEKGSLYEGGVRIPLVVRWPGKIPPGSVCHEPNSSIDLYPTFLSAAGTSPDKSLGLDGLSLLPVLKDPAAYLDRPALFWHYPHYHHDRPSSSIRSGAWKAVEYFDTGELLLFNLDDDLGETTDLASKHPKTASRLRKLLHQWRRDVDAQLPRDNPAYDPGRSGEWWSRRTVKPTQAPGTYHGPER